MDRTKSIDVDLRKFQFSDLMDAMEQAGGFPVVIIPLDENRQPMKSYGLPIVGRAATTSPSFIAGVTWAADLSPIKMIRFVPVEPQKPSV